MVRMSAPNGSRVAQALATAERLHGAQKRKGTDIPYVSHLMAVAGLVVEGGGDEDATVAALLHDAVEDAGGPPTLETIRTQFGDHVAAIVAACSDTDEDPKPPWRERKAAYLHHLRNDDLPDGALLVSLADKLHNARAIVADLREHGDALWSRFNERDPSAQLWYYRWLADVFRDRRPGPLATELARTVEEMTRIAAFNDKPVRLVGRHGDAIEDICDWEQHGAPASKEHWKPGRSAHCAAESWLSGSGARSLRALLDRCAALAGLKIEQAVVEQQTSFDHLRGGRRNHDLLVIGTAGGRRTVIGVEAKADEAFGQTLAEYAKDATPGAAERLELVTRALAGRTPTEDTGLNALRYQLFSGVAGTLAAAAERDAEQAMFVVHEFRTPLTKDAELQRNHVDLERFLETALGVARPIDLTAPIGPIEVPGGGKVPPRMPLFVAKLRTEA
jgi:HD domain